MRRETLNTIFCFFDNLITQFLPMWDFIILCCRALILEKSTERLFIHQYKRLENIFSLKLNLQRIRTWSSLTTNSTICSSKPSLVHLGVAVTKPLRVDWPSFSLVSFSGFFGMQRELGVISSFAHFWRYFSPCVAQFLIYWLTYWIILK